MPATMARLPRDKHGRPIPWFVLIDPAGVPDFRVIRRDGIEDAHRFGLCWVCGQPRGRWAAFLIGPMCAVNRTSAEPPSHRDCAIYSARACPFMSTPTMARRERGLEDGQVAGIMITRNPGVGLVWITRDWKPFQAPGGVLFELGEPAETLWYAHGRDASRAEIQHSIDTGLPILREAARLDGPGGLAELDRRIADTLLLLPAGADTP
jgi:hypothetical protein